MQIIVSCHFPAIWSNSKCTHFEQLGPLSTISKVIPLHNIKWIC